jgi:hypothetical protein
MPATPIATDIDLQDFRRILSQQRIAELDDWQGTRLRKTLAQINRALGNPNRILLGIQGAVLGTHRRGRAISARHGISIANQFLQIFGETVRSGISLEDFYLYQFYLPERWRSRKRQFPRSRISHTLIFLIVRSCSTDFQFLQFKHFFAVRCKETGLPTAPLVGEFSEGQAKADLQSLPKIDLFSKPDVACRGRGATLWRYDREYDCFFNAKGGRKFSQEALLDHLCNLSRQLGQKVILQQRLKNHAVLSPLTNGSLSTLRITTCITPFGSIDLMPPVIRMPAGRMVVDNFAQGGLLAPVDLATGTICGPALQKDGTFGVISIEKHPDSGQPFRGFLIPMWSETLDLARRAHEAFRSVHFIGWDIAILEDGPILVEGNGGVNLDATVLAHGVTLSDTQFIPYYNYHWANSMR